MLTTTKQLLSGFKARTRQGEQGNVLFLILIAVALFAALSYAVTQSSRSGAGTTDGESNLVNSAQLTQFPASVRTAVVRMMINGVDVGELQFNPPADFADLTDLDSTAGTRFGFGVFHPDGGGATSVTSAPDVMAGGAQGEWIYTSQYQIANVGTDAAANTANDVVAFLPGVGTSVCARLNRELGIDNTDDNDSNGIPDSGAVIGDIPVAAMGMVATAGVGTGIQAYAAGRVIDGPDFVGQPFGCADFDDSTAGTANGDLVYYHVLVER